MTPRWTIDGDGWLTFDNNRVMISSWDQDEYNDANGCIRPDAFDALVAAVRDADTLRQARETARLVRALQRDDCRREAILMADSLLDLLSPAPQGEGT